MLDLWALGWEDPLEEEMAITPVFLPGQHSKNKDHGIQSLHFMANRWGNNGNSETIWRVGCSQIMADSDCSHENKRHLYLVRKAMTNLDSILKSRHYFANKGLYSQSYGFSSSHVWM